jgi:hypothetical protein
MKNFISAQCLDYVDVSVYKVSEYSTKQYHLCCLHHFLTIDNHNSRFNSMQPTNVGTVINLDTDHFSYCLLYDFPNYFHYPFLFGNRSVIMLRTVEFRPYSHTIPLEN